MSAKIIGWIGLPFSLAGLAWQLNKTRQSRATLQWTQVPCTISGIDVVAQDSLSDEENFAVTARYTYDVGGRTYSATKVANSHTEFLTREEVARLVDGIPDSGAYRAYFDPNNPADAVLVAGSDLTNLKEAGILLFLLAFSIVMIVKG